MTFRWDDGPEAGRPVQHEIDDVLLATIRDVRDRMGGQPAEAIYQTLVAEVSTRIPAFQPNEAVLRKVAEEIELSEPHT
jgi:hypothetical protein